MPSMAGKRIFPHLLRHNCAAHTLEATDDIRKVSLWLGHANIQSTEIYLRSDPIGKFDVLAARLSKFSELRSICQVFLWFRQVRERECQLAAARSQVYCDRLVRCPLAVKIRLMTWRGRVPVTASSHLPVPSPRRPVNAASPASSAWAEI